jgi:hypothetical protein
MTGGTMNGWARVAALAVATGTTLATGCTLPGETAVAGRITKAPGCGVVLPDEPVCPDLPVVNAFEVRDAAGTLVVRSRTGADGRYRVSLPIKAASYTLTVTLDDPPEPWVTCRPAPFDSVEGRTRRLDVLCGSGIR